MARKVVILGSTGSIGVSTLSLFEQSGAEVEILALTAGKNVALLAQQALRWRPKRAVIAEDFLLPALRDALAGSGVEACAGEAALVETASMGADWVMAAIVGSAGLAPTLAAARSGCVLALANKESLVCAGPALLAASRQAGGRVIPVDSEHSAIFQVLEPHNAHRVSKLILTASGGPFRSWSRAAMAAATPAQAVAHPNWNMGAKISVDSATMMNKGLELIEAAYLFDTPASRIEVLVHPQSIVHSMVEYADGSTLAQLGLPDMRAPIACAFAWPERLDWPAPPLNLATVGALTFEAPDADRFPAIDLAREAIQLGEGGPTALNGANEAAVAAFLDRRIGFLDIARACEEALSFMERSGELAAAQGDDAIETALRIDARARAVTADLVGALKAPLAAGI
jgi:1-deoxy-D-xylulose-5-phosphate reductoisomerase